MIVQYSGLLHGLCQQHSILPCCADVGQRPLAWQSDARLLAFRLYSTGTTAGDCDMIAHDDTLDTFDHHAALTILYIWFIG